MGASEQHGGLIVKLHGILLFSLLLLAHCGHVHQKKIFDPIQKESKERINAKPHWRNMPNMLHATEAVTRGITLQQAIALGLNNNPTLQAHFEDIGIAKADLIQAGFYTNPHLESVFKMPIDNDELRTNVEISASISLSDLWQVPLRKRVAQDNLEVKTYEIITEILQLRKEIQLKYIACIHNQEMFRITEEIANTLEALKDRIEYHYQFGYATDLDNYSAASKLGEWRAKTVEARTLMRTAFIALHEILGSSISSQSIPLHDTIPLKPLNQPQESLKDSALSSHPLIIIERAKMARAKHTISYESSRIIDDVKLGVSYERDFEKGIAGVGPAFGITIPFFNTNSGNSEHARYEYKQAEKTLYARQQMILKDITKHFLNYQSYLDQIALYTNEVLPPIMKAIEFSKDYFDRMQLSLILFLEAHIDLFQHKLKLLELQYNALMAYIELEFALGAQLRNN